ncbi:MAG: hypothetical protein ACI89G_001982, partial [Minisyncoccia bacterium]
MIVSAFLDGRAASAAILIASTTLCMLARCSPDVTVEDAGLLVRH